MTPLAVLSRSTTIRTTMNTTLNNNQYIPVRSDDSHSFGICRLTTLGASDATIQIIVTVSISILPSYRHTLIARLLFPHHFLFYLISFLYLSKYYRLRATSIRDSLFCVDTISDSFLFQYILLIFRFYTDLHLAINYTPDNFLQINFSLVFPQFGFITRLLFMCFVHPRAMPDFATLHPLQPTPTVPFNYQSTDTFDTIFLNLLDDMLSSISTAYMRKILFDKRNPFFHSN